MEDGVVCSSVRDGGWYARWWCGVGCKSFLQPKREPTRHTRHETEGPQRPCQRHADAMPTPCLLRPVDTMGAMQCAQDRSRRGGSGSGFILSRRNKQATFQSHALCFVRPLLPHPGRSCFRDTTRPNRAQKGPTRLAETVSCSLSLGAVGHSLTVEW